MTNPTPAQVQNISDDEMIRCVEREIAMRKRVYPKWVLAGRMKQAEADHEIAAMSAVLNRLLERTGRLTQTLL